MYEGNGFGWWVDIKVDLQARGARVPPEVSARAGGAGPSDGVTLFLGDITATVPTGGKYVAQSPYEIVPADGGWELLKDGKSLCVVEVAGEPDFYKRRTAGGVPYHMIALRHGRDAIGSTVVQGCAHGKDSCMFCAIALSRETGATTPMKRPDDLAEVARAAEEEGYRHMVLTTGTTDGPDRGISHLVRCAAAVKAETGLKVHVQFEPPGDMDLIGQVGDVADSAAINIECLDRWVLERVAPGKAATSLDLYRKAWDRAVGVLGAGQVASFIIAGMGESAYSILGGCTLLASAGVYPFLLPLRPIKGTATEGWSPPTREEIRGIYGAAAGIVATYGLKASACLAGCVRCGACSAFPDITG